MIVLGLYMVLWGKSREMRVMSQLTQSKSSRVSSEAVEVVSSPRTSNNSNANCAMTSFHVFGSKLEAKDLERDGGDNDMTSGS